MSRSSVMIPAGAILTAMLFLGCGGRESTMKATGEAAGSVSLSDLKPIPKEKAGATRLVMILPPEPSSQEAEWEDSARRQAAAEGVIFSSRIPAVGQSQQELIREVAREGVSTLIVIPAGGEDLSGAVFELRELGVPILAMRSSVEIEGEGPAVPVIVRDDPESATDALVAAAVADAPLLGRSAEGPALVIFDSGLPEASERAKALFASAREAGLTLIGNEPMPFSGGRSSARKMIESVRAEHPDLAMVFGADDLSLSAAVSVRNMGEDADRFVVSGFVVDASMYPMIDASFLSAAAIASEDVMGRLAVRNGLELVRGGTVLDRIVAPLPVRRAPGPPAPAMRMPGSIPKPGVSTGTGVETDGDQASADETQEPAMR